MQSARHSTAVSTIRHGKHGQVAEQLALAHHVHQAVADRQLDRAAAHHVDVLPRRVRALDDVGERLLVKGVERRMRSQELSDVVHAQV